MTEILINIRAKCTPTKWVHQVIAIIKCSQSQAHICNDFYLAVSTQKTLNETKLIQWYHNEMTQYNT